jgi:uncharacterized protein (DUF58 family)
MRLPVIPSALTIRALAISAAAMLLLLVAGLPPTPAKWVSGGFLAALTLAFAGDFAVSTRAWRRAAATMTRLVPAALAIGVRQVVHVRVALPTPGAWQCVLYDGTDASLSTDDLPARIALLEGSAAELAYHVTPTRRGEVVFEPADLRIRSRWGLCELRERLGARDVRRVYPDFAQVARYAWLASDRRLREMGVNATRERGAGTNFKELAEYRVGDAVRHIDWRASLRVGKPIVRTFQSERDQCVQLLIDTGRRMRADDRHAGIGKTHFDQVLNAVMLLAYVALHQGDAVGAMTFGAPAGEERAFAPRKGMRSLNDLMGHLYAVEPTPTHADYVAAAEALLRHHRKRSLVVVITNFRDEDTAELEQALRLLRSRHLVLVASLRERVVAELMASPLDFADAAVDVASAHLYEQNRRDAFNRLSARDGLMVDAEPEQLGIALVNRYHAMKRAGRI